MEVASRNPSTHDMHLSPPPSDAKKVIPFLKFHRTEHQVIMVMLKTLSIALLGLVLPVAARHSESGISSTVSDIPPLGLGTWRSDREEVRHSQFILEKITAADP
jgi:hypothetical protein